MTKNYNENYVREAAYYNWQNAGCPSGQDEYFWTMAMNQLYGSKCSCTKACKTSTKSSSTKSSASKSSSSKKSSSKK